MAFAAGSSGDGGGDRRSSRGKEKIIVDPHDKKMSIWEKAMLRYLQRCHEDVVAVGHEPPFGGCYAPPPVPDISSPLSTTVAGGTNKSQDEVGSAFVFAVQKYLKSS
uniref:Uncharacterized protein n=1 Tax=Setaria viridis TaxID=4556 RepID=A0A4U6STI0_SETVI|nr:hypothetical protein SEVIR_9G026200v2 [Setaria viridis]